MCSSPRCGDPADDRARGRDRLRLVVLRKEERELVPAEAEGLAVLAKRRRQAGEDAVAGGVPEEVVDPLEIVHVDEAEAEAAALALGLDQLTLEPIVEVAVVAEPRQRVGQREPHRAERAVGRALVEGDREQRADEGRRQEGRALPENDEHERGRRHQREDHDRPAQARSDQLEERSPRRDGHDERDESEVDRVLGEGRDSDLGDQRVDSIPGDEGHEASRRPPRRRRRPSRCRRPGSADGVRAAGR